MTRSDSNSNRERRVRRSRSAPPGSSPSAQSHNSAVPQRANTAPPGIRDKNKQDITGKKKGTQERRQTTDSSNSQEPNQFSTNNGPGSEDQQATSSSAPETQSPSNTALQPVGQGLPALNQFALQQNELQMLQTENQSSVQNFQPATSSQAFDTSALNQQLIDQFEGQSFTLSPPPSWIENFQAETGPPAAGIPTFNQFALQQNELQMLQTENQSSIENFQAETDPQAAVIPTSTQFPLQPNALQSLQPPNGVPGTRAEDPSNDSESESLPYEGSSDSFPETEEGSTDTEEDSPPSRNLLGDLLREIENEIREL